jgi:hypothetical protein
MPALGGVIDLSLLRMAELAPQLLTPEKLDPSEAVLNPK